MRATNSLIVSATLVATSLLGACAPPPAAAQPPPSAASAPAPQDASTLQDRSWGVVRSPLLGLKLALPEARAWLPERRALPGAAWELRHEPTQTSLSVHRWRSSRLPRVDSCEVELRERTPGLLSVDEINLVARREVRIPEGFLTRITLLAAPGRGARLQGQVLAIGAGVGECISVVARTECATEAELAERLRLLDASVGHLRLVRIEDRVPDPQPISR